MATRKKVKATARRKRGAVEMLRIKGTGAGDYTNIEPLRISIRAARLCGGKCHIMDDGKDIVVMVERAPCR